jgi:hypothetical protein
MASSNYSCSVRQGFNFEKDTQTLVGHLTKLKIGETDLAQDLAVTNPTDSANPVKVVGVISQISWEGGYTDPVILSAQISNENKKTVAVMVHTNLVNTEIDCTFDIYDYDPKAKVYYKCFHTDGKDLKGLIMKRGGELSLMIDSDEGREVPSPLNYGFYLGFMPQDTDQAIQVAVSNTDKFAKKWGVAVAA